MFPSWPHRAAFQTLALAVCGVGIWLIPPRMLQHHRSADGGLFLCVCEIIHNVLSRLNFNRGSFFADPAICSCQSYFGAIMRAQYSPSWAVRLQGWIICRAYVRRSADKPAFGEIYALGNVSGPDGSSASQHHIFSCWLDRRLAFTMTERKAVLYGKNVVHINEGVRSLPSSWVACEAQRQPISSCPDS